MAWEEIEVEGSLGCTGDVVVDEIALALGKIAKAYEARWGRRPQLFELLRAIETVIGADPSAYVCDPTGLELATLHAIRR